VKHQQRRAAVVAVMFAIGCAVVEGGDDKSIEFAGETRGDPAVCGRTVKKDGEFDRHQGQLGDDDEIVGHQPAPIKWVNLAADTRPLPSVRKAQE